MKKALLLILILGLPAGAKKFYDDDPLLREPPPMAAEMVEERRLSMYYDYFLQTFGKPAEAQPKPKEIKKGAKPIPARAVNTLGEVPDSTWFTNRIGTRPMSVDEVVRGPRRDNAPSQEGKWSIVGAKTAGVTPGFTIKDATGKRYILKFDPMTNPEMATSVDVVGSLFFHALGYHVPENYIVYFDRPKLVIGEGTTLTDLKGREQAMQEEDVEKILERVPRTANGRFRGLASYYLGGRPAGEFRYHGTRPDDPNDIVPHEHRRDLRGLFVFCAWLGHDDSRAINTLDMVVEENGVPFVRHHLVDFGSILGSASVYSNSSRSGNEHLFEWGKASKQVLTLGFAPPRYHRLKYNYFPSVGKFDYRVFDPEQWTTEEPNPAFKNRLPDDTFWAAKKVMAFSDQHIRAVIEQGQYSDPEAVEWLIECLIKRRDIVGRKYFTAVLALDHFRAAGGRLEFENLAVKHGFAEPEKYQVEWSTFDNDAEKNTPIEGATSLDLPREVVEGGEGAYFAARLEGADPAKTVTVYLRKNRAALPVVGIDRTW